MIIVVSVLLPILSSIAKVVRGQGCNTALGNTKTQLGDYTTVMLALKELDADNAAVPVETVEDGIAVGAMIVIVGMRLHSVFQYRNLDTSQPSVSRDLRRLCSGLAHLRLRSAHPPHQKSSAFNEGSEGIPPLPS